MNEKEAVIFSVIIATYNRGALIEKAINSVLNQSFKNFQLIVVDDGSTDSTKQKIQQFDDNRILYIHQKNSERSAARNNGVAHALGEWICFLDSDDYLLPDYLEQLAIAISKSNKSCLIVGYWRSSISYSTIDFPETNFLRFCIENSRPIGVCELIISTEVLKKEQFDERFNVWEDTHLFYRILAKYDYDVCNTIGYVIVEHEGSGVVQAEQKVDLKMVNTYILAIKDLFQNHDLKLGERIQNRFFKEYIYSKIQMFSYRAYITNDSNSFKRLIGIMISEGFITRYPFYLIKSITKFLILKLKR